ncbi:MAG: DUF3043 domain-containing protein [Bifidobacteriaceae bacterium]|jgi:hypothetical protein|nr:DUF3043 domain-containing protein [Bifidobacteriaceae bacterium]MCI1915370.1 DUF3043 domain-containing protein [Bifidobacteriaceae bacterium]
MTWNPFSKNKDKENTAAVSAAAGDEAQGTKGHATPTRKEAQARSVRPLIPDPKDRKKRVKEERARLRERQNEEYDAMQKGDVAHMPRAERNPIRVYIRTYIDARWNLAEFFIPVAVVCLLGSLFLSAAVPMLSFILAMAMYVYLFVIIIDMVIMWRGLKRKLTDKFGDYQLVKNARGMSYAMSRALQLRRFRLPKPSSKKHGNWPK